MADGEMFHCKKCGKEISFANGWVFMSYPRGSKDEEYYIPMANGKYGKTAQKILNSNPKAFVRFQVGTFYCEKCNHFDQSYYLTIEEGDENEDTGAKILYTTKHTCSKCGRISREANFSDLKVCPKCGTPVGIDSLSYCLCD